MIERRLSVGRLSVYLVGYQFPGDRMQFRIEIVWRHHR